MSIQQLIQQLTDGISQFTQQYQHRLEEKIFAKFDRTLFSENGQTTAYYLKEIQQTLTKIQTLQSNDINHYQFLAERLTAQCATLSEALNRRKSYRSTETPKMESTYPKKPAAHHIHQLPPRERLEKYYEALAQLTDLYHQHCDLARNTASEAERVRYHQRAQAYQARRQKCQEAIDLLEEYLAFKQEQENAQKSD